MNRIVETVNRPDLGKVYRYHMCRYLMMLGMERETAIKFVESVISNRFVDKTIVSIDKEGGHLRFRKTGLLNFTKKMSDVIVTPSGSFYEPHYKKMSLMSVFAEDGLAKRKILKNKQFECKAAGDSAGELQAMYAQTQVKINLNSLPGGFGSPYNIFYDKGGYNAITSVARALIAHAYTTAELCLGGNPAVFDFEELINWVMTATGKMPDNETIARVTDKYGIKWATKKDLLDYFVDTLGWYNPGVNKDQIKSLISMLTDYQIQYMYYLGNLPHLLFNNDNIFRNKIKDILSHEILPIDGIDPNDFKKIDSDIFAVAMTIRAKELEGINIKEIITEAPDVARQIVATANSIQNKLKDLDELMETFIYSNISTQKILTRTNMRRHTVVVSDTDSIIFTSKNWLKWYTGTLEGLSQESYDIAALATYFITKVNEDSMAKFAIDCGATGKYVRQMKMKNEYLYPILLIYDIKKTYCGIVRVQEGVICPDGDLDLKGGALRSSNIPPISLDFIKNFIENHILNPAEKGRLKASKLIETVLDYEVGIRGSLERLETTFVKRESINMKGNYSKPESSAWMYGVAWNDIFSKKYGNFYPPDKVSVLKLLIPTPEYYETVKRMDEELYRRMLKYVETYGKFPTSVVIPNNVSGIPRELSPIINTREIIWNNMRPTYHTLERLGIYVGYKKENALLSDFYTT